MYSNYIFDLYGTLVDINTDEDSTDFWYKLSLFYSYKGAKYSAKELKEMYIKKVNDFKATLKDTLYPDFPLEIIFKELYEDKDIIPSTDLVNDTAHLFRALSTKYVKLYDGAIELLELLKKKNKRIYLLSNAQRIFTLYEMRILGIEKYFDDIFFSADYKVCKPDSTFYNNLIEKYNIDVKKSIMICNDYIADILGSTNVGLDSLYLHSNLSPEIKGELTSTHTLMEIDLFEAAKLIIK